jgi:hypothetical protein
MKLSDKTPLNHSINDVNKTEFAALSKNTTTGTDRSVLGYRHILKYGIGGSLPTISLASPRSRQIGHYGLREAR